MAKHRSPPVSWCPPDRAQTIQPRRIESTSPASTSRRGYNVECRRLKVPPSFDDTCGRVLIHALHHRLGWPATPAWSSHERRYERRRIHRPTSGYRDRCLASRNLPPTWTSCPRYPRPRDRHPAPSPHDHPFHDARCPPDESSDLALHLIEDRASTPVKCNPTLLAPSGCGHHQRRPRYADVPIPTRLRHDLRYPTPCRFPQPPAAPRPGLTFAPPTHNTLE